MVVWKHWHNNIMATNNTNTHPDFDENTPGQSPEEDFNPPHPRELDLEMKRNVTEFKSLLDSIQTTDGKVKALWRQTYENASTDRKNAYIAFADLYMQVHGNADRHAIHGLTLSKYLERMEKSNTQLLKLVELIDKAKKRDEEEADDDDNTAPASARDLFSRLENKTPFTKQQQPSKN